MSSPKYGVCLWYPGAAEEAAEFYTSILDDSEITQVFRPAPGAPAVTVAFRLGDSEFIALNGDTAPAFTEAASIVVRRFGTSVTTPAEMRAAWEALTVQEGPSA